MGWCNVDPSGLVGRTLEDEIDGLDMLYAKTTILIGRPCKLKARLKRRSSSLRCSEQTMIQGPFSPDVRPLEVLMKRRPSEVWDLKVIAPIKPDIRQRIQLNGPLPSTIGPQPMCQLSRHD